MNLIFKWLGLTFIAMSFLTSCATSPKSNYSETGIASWYGEKFHGRKTASGEIFNMNALTAAHPRLPFGTQLLVTSKTTRKSVLVRVNDRGPFARRRIIDLSYAAAKQLGMIALGEDEVEITLR